MRRDMLEFLFIGPLFSIFKVLNQIRRNLVALKDELQQLNSRLQNIADELSRDIQRLQDKIANTPAAEDVSAELEALRNTASQLESLDVPETEGNTSGSAVVVGPGTVLPGGEPATDSPGENQQTEEPESPGTVEDPAPSETEPVDEDTGENV